MKKYLFRSSVVILFLFSFLFKENIYNLLSYINYIFTFNNSYNSNELLRIENINLKAELNDLLLINNIEYDGINIKNAKIVLNNLYNNNNIIINKGSEDKVKKDSLIINSNGLIGVIKKVYKNHSIGLLLFDVNISVKINNSYYILKYDNNFYVEGENNLNKLDVVYTSGIGSYPEGIVVGYVYSTIGNKTYIKSKVDFENINYVSIVEN